MFKFLYVAILVVAVSAQDDGQYRPELYNQGGNDGRYYPSDDGKYVHVGGGNDGRYYPSDDGKYVHIGDGDRGQYNGDNGKYVHQGDDAGKYVHQSDAGKYVHQGDNPGKYVHQGDNPEKYVHQGDNPGKYVHQGGNNGGNGQYNGNNQQGGSGSGNRGGSNRGTGGNPNQSAGAGGRPNNGNRPGTGGGHNFNGNQGPSSPTGKFEGGWRIIKHIKTQDEDGYHYEYETENRIFGEEEGKLHNKGTDEEALKAHGYYKYTGPDNVVYRVDYTADENGFVPQGAHLHPVPESVKRTLEYLKKKGLL